MTDHSQCRLLLAAEEQPSPGTGSPAPTQAPPRPTAHYRTRHPLQSRSVSVVLALWRPREQAQSLCPPPHHTRPLQTRLTPHLAAARPAAHLPCFAGPLCPAVPGFPVEGPGSVPWP